MQELKLKLINNDLLLLVNIKTEKFIELINSNKQFLTLDVRRYYGTENYYRDDNPFSEFVEKIVLNKNLIIEFNIY